MAKKPLKKRLRSIRNKAREPQKRRPARSEEPELEREEEDLLSEFSDETNKFYTDEIVLRERKRRDSAKAKAPAKKQEKRKPMSPTQRKIIRILSYGAIIAVVLIVGVVLSLTVLFKTQVYEVTGNTRYAEDEIIETCGIGKGENIFLAPKGPAENRLKKKFPYVEEANVSFRIPDTIRIAIVEADEGYLVKVSDKEYLMISTKGRILNQVTDPSSYDLPIFIGPKLTSGEIGDYVSYEDETVLDMIESITQTFADNGYQGITEIDATNTADISFTYDDRIKVKLGIPEELDYKVRTAMTIINENLDKNQTGTVTGILDVSRCHSTKRSYFNEQAIHPTEAQATEKPTEAAASGEEWSDGESGQEENYDFYSDEEAYYYDDSYAYGDGWGW